MLEYFNTSQAPRPQDIFLSALIQFATVMMKIVHQVYRPQAAPSVLWSCAMAVGKDMDALRARARTDFGLELDAPRSSDPRGMRPVVLITCSLLGTCFSRFLAADPYISVQLHDVPALPPLRDHPRQSANRHLQAARPSTCPRTSPMAQQRLR